MKKPKHTPARTVQLEEDPQFLLIALNLLIEGQKSKRLPREFLSWLREELVAPGLSHIHSNSGNYRKSA